MFIDALIVTKPFVEKLKQAQLNSRHTKINLDMPVQEEEAIMRERIIKIILRDLVNYV